MEVVDFDSRVMAVFLEGITHLLIPLDEAVPEATALKIFEEVRGRFASRIPKNGAFGVIPFWRKNGVYVIAPVVCVPATNSIIPETGCGSGSVALALAQNEKQVCVQQPSGATYNVSIQETVGKRTVVLGSDVQLLLSGTAFIID